MPSDCRSNDSGRADAQLKSASGAARNGAPCPAPLISHQANPENFTITPRLVPGVRLNALVSRFREVEFWSHIPE